jgi:hypothetical protein
MGVTLTSEDSSEVAFLLVENYNYDCSCWSSDRQGIFAIPMSLTSYFLLFIDLYSLLRG